MWSTTDNRVQERSVHSFNSHFEEKIEYISNYKDKLPNRSGKKKWLQKYPILDLANSVGEVAVLVYLAVRDKNYLPSCSSSLNTTNNNKKMFHLSRANNQITIDITFKTKHLL